MNSKQLELTKDLLQMVILKERVRVVEIIKDAFGELVGLPVFPATNVVLTEMLDRVNIGERHEWKDVEDVAEVRKRDGCKPAASQAGMASINREGAGTAQVDDRGTHGEAALP